MTTGSLNKDASNEEDVMSLKDLILKLVAWFRYLLSKWVWIFCFGLLGGVLGYFYAISKKPIYTATTTFVLEESGSGSGSLAGLGGIASMVGLDVGSGGGIFQGDNILELYKSRTMIQKTLLTPVKYKGKEQLLVEVYLNFNGIRKVWQKHPELKNLKFVNDVAPLSRLQDSVLGSIVNDINLNYLKVAKPDRKLSLIRADVKSRNEYFAKTFNDQIVENVNEFYIQTKTKKSLENVNILTVKADSVRAVMNGAIYTAAVVADATPNLNPTRQVQRSAPIQRSQFSAETNKIILSELVKNLEMSKMALLKEAPLIQVVDTPVFPLQMDKFGKAKGIILGGFIMGFLTVLFLIFKRLLRLVMA